jgi:type III pantothenate kinase
MIKIKNKPILLAIDIGNTTISAGLFIGERLTKKFRISTWAKDEQILFACKNTLARYSNCKINAIISSVVPKATRVVANILKHSFHLTPVIVGTHLDVPIKNMYSKPRQVGCDRLVNAYACRQIYGAPAIIIDFGTATTFDFLNKKGQYEGGIITPGVKITLDALAEKTALLPKVILKKPKKLIGKDTKDSIRSGVVNGLACMCDGLVEMIMKERKIQPIIIATGGMADIFCCYSKYINKIDNDLILKGLYLIFFKKTSMPLDL